MRRVYAFLLATLDGFHEGPNQEIDWHNVDDEFSRFATSQLDDSDLLLFGRVTYELMAGYWPTPAARAADPVIAEKMNTLPKVVFSTTLDRAEWNNTRLVTGNAADEVSQLRQHPGKDIAILGSSTLTAGLIRAGLVDELRVLVNPVVLGDGNTLLRGIDGELRLGLLQARIFAGSGNVLLTYQPRP